MKKIFSLVMILSMAFALSACDGGSQKTSVVPAQEKAKNTVAAEAKKDLNPKDLWSNDDPFVGEKNAPIEMVVFSDFQCPYCAEFFETLEKLQADWVDTGRLKIQYRDFPLTMHYNSVPAHVAANAAARQGKYMEMHALLFEKQSEWESATNPKKFFRDYAKEIGLDIKQYEKDSAGPDVATEIQEDKDIGRQAGVSGTPGFFINGVYYDGALSHENMIKVLTQAEEVL